MFTSVSFYTVTSELRQALPLGIEAMMAALAHEGRSGLLVINEAFTNAHRDAIIALAARYRLPAVYPFRFFAAAGGLMCYGIDLNDLFRRTGDYINRILTGAKPSDLPIQNPTKFERVINLKTAKTRCHHFC